ncbi:GDSL esterase/lipase At2g40250-like [Silene latifolia]|uniref:GDSL esterase/lipase At2g40250-like n=1 Tax=Silene latifolia TaxID=37657 RepID=UPI003D76F0B6
MISLLLLVILATTAAASAANSTHPVSAIYVFGDSTVDSGNNDYMKATLFRADHAPYGENFPNRVATGRFSDGLIATDYLAKYFGLKEFLPAYADPTVTDKDLLTGISFASAGSGLDDLTIKITRAIDLTTQISNFQQAISRLEKNIEVNKTGWTLENAMFFISVGSNDMLINYYDLPTRRLKYTPSGYSDFIISKLQPVIESLYKLGARRFAVAGLPPLGCVPMQVSVGSIFHGLKRVCIDKQNSDSQAYNGKLQHFLTQLHSQYPNAKFAYGDIYTPLMDMIKNPSKYGFQVTLEGCCGTGVLEAGTLCNAVAPTCQNASNHVFFDSVHPTQAAFHVIANALETDLLTIVLD